MVGNDPDSAVEDRIRLPLGVAIDTASANHTLFRASAAVDRFLGSETIRLLTNSIAVAVAPCITRLEAGNSTSPVQYCSSKSRSRDDSTANEAMSESSPFVGMLTNGIVEVKSWWTTTPRAQISTAELCSCPLGLSWLDRLRLISGA